MADLPSDLDIARTTPLLGLDALAARAGLDPAALEPYGRHVAKVPLDGAPRRPEPGKLIVVTAVTPTPLGEGKTTTSVGLAQGLVRLGYGATVAVRQPSLGPTFGIKGGAAGGGYSQILPMEQMNLHLTGDTHAVSAAHNLLAAMVDNHLHQGNAFDLDQRALTWRRVVDMNDRSLRMVVIGLGAKEDGLARQTGFDITAASEVMVILALATSLADLRERLGRIVVGFTMDGRPVTAEELKAAGAMAVLLKDAMKPNLLQTTENTPALVHAGPFGNIATGHSSVAADRLGVMMGDYLVTEAGFGSDMGAERFFNIKSRTSGIQPAAAVLVATVRAMKAHSGRYRVVAGRPLPPEMLAENPEDVRMGAANLEKHLQILHGFGVPVVVAINAFDTDHASEHDVIVRVAEAAGARVAVTTHVREGGAGAEALAREVVAAAATRSVLRHTYELDEPLAAKIEAIALRVYGAAAVDYALPASADLARLERLGFGHVPVVIAKTHLSISADPKLLGAPTGWRLYVREVRLAAGAGYVYAICGEMRTMPGLGAHPAAERMDLDEHGNVVGLS